MGRSRAKQQLLHQLRQDWTTSNVSNLTYNYTLGSGLQSAGIAAPPPQKKTALDWLDSRVDEMRKVGREALA